jgi:hypothetical protein
VNGGRNQTLDGGVSQGCGIISILPGQFGVTDIRSRQSDGAYRKEPGGRVQIRPRRDPVQEGVTQEW